MRGCACRGTAGFAHVSCLVEQAKILMDEGEENNLDNKVKNERWKRWETCGLCEQDYHGVVRCALGWACWKTYLGRPEADQIRNMGIGTLSNGLSAVDKHAERLEIFEAQMDFNVRFGVPLELMLVTKTNLAVVYGDLGRMLRITPRGIRRFYIAFRPEIVPHCERGQKSWNRAHRARAVRRRAARRPRRTGPCATRSRSSPRRTRN